MAAARQAVIKQVHENPRTGFGNLADTLRQARQQDPNITRQDVKRFMDGLVTSEDRPQRGYNSYVPPEPMHQLQVDLADMGSFARGPKFKDSAPKKVRRAGPSLSKQVEAPKRFSMQATANVQLYKQSLSTS